MIGSRERVLHVGDFADVFEETKCELMSILRNMFDRRWIREHPAVYYLLQNFSSGAAADIYTTDQLRKVVFNQE